jgi:hypothetical protein
MYSEITCHPEEKILILENSGSSYLSLLNDGITACPA